MPIEFEPTPNPDALRVTLGVLVSQGPPRQFSGPGAADPLAVALLAIPGVARVLIGGNFVTVVRAGPEHDWAMMRPEIVLALTDALESAAAPSPAPERAVPAGDIAQQIEEVLDRWVRPLLAADGGDVVLIGFDPADGTATVRMEGACGGCPSGAITLKRGIEQSIRRWVPEVSRVVAAAEESPTADPKARFRSWVAAKWGRG